MLTSVSSIFKFIAGSIQFWLGIILLTAGVGKMFHGHFIGFIGPVWLETELQKYNLGLYGIFIALSQIIIGFLLLVKRFATLGAIMAIPMFLNILIITIALEWRGTPYIVAFLLICNIYLLIYDFHRIKFLLTDSSESLKKMPIIREDVKLDSLYLAGLLVILLAVSLRNLIPDFAPLIAYAGLISFILVYLYSLWKRKNAS